MLDLQVNDEPKQKLPKKGIIYLSTIPPYINVTKIREIFSEYGTVGRVYLQLEDKEPKTAQQKSKKRTIAKKFTEGWIEFERKSVAKKVVAMLNNTQVSNRKKSKHFDYIWNIKYLSNFKWVHLHERLAYEKAARRQKLRAEIQLAKKKTNFFTSNLSKSKKQQPVSTNEFKFKRKPATDTSENIEDRKEFLSSLFN